MASNQIPPTSDIISDFFNQLFSTLETGVNNFKTNFYNSFATVSARRWIRVAVIVTAYLLLRPYIEKLFKWSYERDRRKEKERKEKEAQATGAEKGRKAKVPANSLRGGSGKVLGEVENTDDEVDEAEEFANASGVPEWGKNARKRQKKYLKNLEKEVSNRRAEELSEEQILELLDWSDSEDEDGKKKRIHQDVVAVKKDE